MSGLRSRSKSHRTMVVPGASTSAAPDGEDPSPPWNTGNGSAGTVLPRSQTPCPLPPSEADRRIVHTGIAASSLLALASSLSALLLPLRWRRWLWLEEDESAAAAAADARTATSRMAFIATVADAASAYDGKSSFWRPQPACPTRPLPAEAPAAASHPTNAMAQPDPIPCASPATASGGGGGCCGGGGRGTAAADNDDDDDDDDDCCCCCCCC